MVSVAETSFVAAPEVYRAALTAAGFAITAERDRGEFALAAMAAQRAKAAAEGPSPLGLQHAMGPTVAAKVGNMVKLIQGGVIAPYEMIARRA